VLLVYSAALFVAAALLFLVQPLFARMVLPLLGGSPGVWNTALVFYQAALLAGYAYAHAALPRLALRRQVASQLVLLALAAVALPFGVPSGWSPPAQSDPTPWLLGLLSVAVGPPFVVLATTSPVLQRWFAAAGHRASADPYFLYAASNAGSLVGLLGYPLLLEPRFGVAELARLWAVGFGALVLLVAACAALALRRSRAEAAGPDPGAPPDAPAGPDAVTRQRALGWVALAFVPSSLMMGATTHIATDIASFPLLWVVPLAIYLLTFILAFARRPPVPHGLMVRALPMVVLPMVVALALRANQPVVLLVPLHLLVLFVAALLCHGLLARDRPSARHLTAFYLWLSVGGALGGLFNALVAPQVFTSIAEYPIALVLACLLGPAGAAGLAAGGPRARLLDLAVPAALGAATAWAIAGAPLGGALAGPIYALAALAAFGASGRPLRFGLAVAAILAAAGLDEGRLGRTLEAERSFFGVSRVARSEDGALRLLYHGTSLHGAQRVAPERPPEPLAYYARSGPLGQVFAELGDRLARRPVGAVGLGTGSVACYRRPDQAWTFYEIDPTVARIARDGRHFGFLQGCAPDAAVVLGDARLSLRDAADGGFGILVLDAYSSDAIPLHLITREALALYLAKLAPDGVLVFHISNRHLDLEPVLGRLAADAGLTALSRRDVALDPAARRAGTMPSEYVVMARDAARLVPLDADPRWTPVRTDAPLWTDDFASVLAVFRWF